MCHKTEKSMRGTHTLNGFVVVKRHNIAELYYKGGNITMISAGDFKTVSHLKLTETYVRSLNPARKTRKGCCFRKNKIQKHYYRAVLGEAFPSTEKFPGCTY